MGKTATLFTPIGIAAFIGTELVFGAIDFTVNDTPDTYVGKALSWTAGLFSSGSRAWYDKLMTQAITVTAPEQQIL